MDCKLIALHYLVVSFERKDDMKVPSLLCYGLPGSRPF